MSIITAKGLPSAENLIKEGIEVLSKDTKIKPQRPLSIIIVNLMPKKEVTEQQLLRLIGMTPLPVNIEFIYMDSYCPKHVSKEYLREFYKTFEDIKDQTFDGIIITGAPIEHLPYEDVAYYEELKAITKWSETHVTKRLFICWGAQFALNYYYGIQKYPVSEKIFGIYKYHVDEPSHPIFKGTDDFYNVPVSRHTQIKNETIKKVKNLLILTSNSEFGADIIATKDNKDLFILGHLEYDRYSLANEYKRDVDKGLEINLPKNYYPNNDLTQRPILSWRNHANILFSNWVGELSKSVQ